MTKFQLKLDDKESKDWRLDMAKYSKQIHNTYMSERKNKTVRERERLTCDYSAECAVASSGDGIREAR